MKFDIPDELGLDKRGQTTLILAREALEKHEPDRAARLLQRAKIENTEAQVAHDLMLAVTLSHCNYPGRALQTVMNSLATYHDMTDQQRLFHLIMQGELLGVLGQGRLAVKVLGPCPAKAAELGRTDLAIEALIQEGAALSTMGDQAAGIDRIDRALSLSRDRPEKRLTVRALAERSVCLYRRGDVNASLRSAKEAVELSHEDHSLPRALAYGRIGAVYGTLFRFFESLEAHQCALGVFNKLAHIPGQLGEYLSLADTYVNMGDIGLALHFARRAQVLAEDGDNPITVGYVHDRLGRLCLASGAFSAAMEHYTRQLAIAERVDGSRSRARAEHHLGVAEVFAGELDKALRHFAGAIDGFSASGDRIGSIRTLLDLSQIEPLLSDEARAPVFGGAARRDIDEREIPPHPELLAKKHFATAYRYLTKERWPEALAHHGEGIEVLSRHGCYLDVALSLFLFGKLVMDRDTTSACEILERALRLSDTHGFGDLTRMILDTVGGVAGRGEAIVVEYSLDKAAVKQLGDDPNSQGDETYAGATHIVGSSPAIRTILDEVEEFAPTDLPVLILGQSGTGKELVARRVHELSRRAKRPFVAVNCATLPSGIIDVELFGGKKGAYTGLSSDRKGLVLQADGGTLFLDELGDFPVDLQPKLLRFVQEGEVRPLGSDTTHPVDVRIVTATNKDLEGAVRDGTFREDLFYRLNVVTLDLPPLARRGQDVLAIARFFIERNALAARKGITGISRAAAALLLEHAWPGNIRELENVIQVAIVKCRTDKITTEDLKLKPLPRETPEAPPSSGKAAAAVGDIPGDIKSRDELMYDNLRRTLKVTHGNQSEAAKRLGIHRNTLRNWIKRMKQDGEPLE
jgi:DNA-binding NtrC family response regulator